MNLYSNNPVLYLKAFLKLHKYISDNKIKFVISVLWKSHFVIYFVSLFKKINIIPFIVGVKYFNLFDQIFSGKVIKSAKNILVDSKKGEQRIRLINPKATIYSFLIFTPLNINRVKHFSGYEETLTFIFVGRINPVKRLDKAFEFLNLLSLHLNKEIKFDIYGPLEKGVDLNSLFIKYSHLKISYKGVMLEEERTLLYPKYNFYLQFSDSEGSGMSIIEAMRFGLIPVITNVGEVVDYCNSGFNSIIMNREWNGKQMVDHFNEILISISIERLSKNSFETFENVTMFNDLILNILNDLYAKEI